MKDSQALWVTLDQIGPPQTRGAADLFRMELAGFVHASPIKAAINRPVRVVLTAGQAAQLALDVLNHLPALGLARDENFRKGLDHIYRVLSVEDRIETDPAAG